jgi:hypothetical protein
MAGLRLVTLISDNGVPTCPDGPTFALLTSDFSRITTMSILAKVVREIRASAKGFLGKGFGSSERASLEQAVEAIFERNIQGGFLRTGNYKIRQTRIQQVQGKIDIDLNLGVPYELRQVTLSVSLEA